MLSETRYSDSHRMGLRGTIRVASEALPAFWPMRSFVHHNPLHGLEELPFDRALRQGEHLFGGRGYLPRETYRAYWQAGRIRPGHLDAALQTLANEGGPELALGDRRVGQREVLRACLTHGIGEEALAPARPARGASARPQAALVRAIAERLREPLARRALAPTPPAAGLEDGPALARRLTLADCCDRALGTSIVECVNRELVKWCGAFLDEGHATWPMPGREQGFYLAWRALASREWRPCGIAGSRKSIRALPDAPEDAILESLQRLGVPEESWQDYLALELASLPGWAGYIKWRAEQRNHAWQQVYPAGLVKFLAVRLWYERELVAAACRRHLGVEGNLSAMVGAIATDPVRAALLARPARGLTPEAAAARLVALALALELAPEALREADPGALVGALDWIEGFGPADRDAVWQRAFEAGFQESLLAQLDRPRPVVGASGLLGAAPVRPQSQSFYCLDVRTEPFRRHLEALGDHETFALAGFFGAAIRFKPWGGEGFIDQFPAVMQPRNEVREVPRSYHEHLVPKHRERAGWLSAGQTLLRELKENVVTPFVMVESLGWFYGLPLVGKTLLPVRFHKFFAWARAALLPAIPTGLIVDKLSQADVEAMVASEQRDTIWKALRARFGQRGVGLDPRFVEALRLCALGHPGAPEPGPAAAALGLTPAALEELVEALRREGQIEARSASRRKERLTRTGLTIEEQVATLETILRTIGLTQNFARLVLVCAHGSTSENNPYESALDCGACGGNEGSPNARAVAMMANNPRVRERLATVGIAIPADTRFLAGLLDTTTDAVRLYDLEDLPSTLRKDVARLQDDLAQAGRMTSEERLARLPGAMDARSRPDQVLARSVDWSQMRPEWGLSGNAAFIIGPRGLSKGLDLGGRVFMHSYEASGDPTGRLLELILTGPQLVAQWISMEHYFSTTANDVFGSGSKVYHNVAGRIGVMSGLSSDLRMGLARQTVMSGERPYHEPMRLLAIVAARRATIDALIARHALLQNYYQREWVHLVAWDPDDSRLYRYQPSGGWSLIDRLAPHMSLGKEPIA